MGILCYFHVISMINLFEPGGASRSVQVKRHVTAWMVRMPKRASCCFCFVDSLSLIHCLIFVSDLVKKLVSHAICSNLWGSTCFVPPSNWLEIIVKRIYVCIYKWENPLRGFTNWAY